MNKQKQFDDIFECVDIASYCDYERLTRRGVPIKEEDIMGKPIIHSLVSIDNSVPNELFDFIISKFDARRIHY
jgi:hypothetical protein